MTECRRDERTLPAARIALENAIASLIDPRPTSLAGNVVWINSVYTELNDAITSNSGSAGHHPPGPQTPCWLDGVILAEEIDTQTRKWVRRGHGPEHPTVNRLRYVVAHRWRPQDVQLVTDIAEQVTAWVKRYRTLVDDKPKSLPNPCPRCAQKWAYRQLDGERIRQPALQVTVEVCRCGACGAEWQPSQYAFLARMLGYARPDGVIA